jgi:hypothetical protein
MAMELFLVISSFRPTARLTLGFPLPMFLTQGGHRTHRITLYSSFIIKQHKHHTQAITILQHIMILFHFYHMDNNKIMLQPISISKFKQRHQYHFGFSTQFQAWTFTCILVPTYNLLLESNRMIQFQAWTSTCISVPTYNLFLKSNRMMQFQAWTPICISVPTYNLFVESNRIIQFQAWTSICISSYNTFCPAPQLWSTLYQVLSIQSIHFSLLNVLKLSLHSAPFASLF